MKAATVRELKKELSHRSPEELLELCLRLSKFKKVYFDKRSVTKFRNEIYKIFWFENDLIHFQNIKIKFSLIIC